MLDSLTLGGDGAGGFPARRGCPNLHHRTGRDEASRPSAKVSLLRKVSRQRMARFARRAWFEGPVQRKEPFPGKIFTPCVPERRFAGLFGCIARISCQSQLILNTRRRYAATNWRFSRPKPLLGCMERKICHGLPPGNTFREHFTIGKRPGTHRARILPLPVRPRAHQGAILPPSDAGKRISRAFCHRQAPGKRIFATSCQRSGIFVRAGLLPCYSSHTA